MRIGHAVSALGDTQLLEYMAEQRIGVECNLTSNVQTSTVADYPSHPLRRFLEKGILATINTDDPGISNIDLAYEYNVAAPAACLSLEHIHQCQMNALQVAFLSDQEKQALLSKKSKGTLPKSYRSFV
jgi:adenosine deaminase